MLEFILTWVNDKPVWILDGYPISIRVDGAIHFVQAKDIHIKHIVNHPDGSKEDIVHYICKSVDGRVIAGTALHQSIVIPTFGAPRYGSQSFPSTDSNVRLLGE